LAARNIFLIAYVLSGFSALVYEIVWVRQATHVLGASLYGVSAVTGLFLAGLALGALLGSKHLRSSADTSELLQKRLQLFLKIEVGVAGAGALLPLAFSANMQQTVWSSLGDFAQGNLSYVLRLLFVALLVVPPAAGIGTTFPLVVSILGPRLKFAAQRLYAANTAGAAIGAFSAAFLLLPVLGLQASSWLAAGLDVLAGLLAISVGTGLWAAAQSQENSETDEQINSHPGGYLPLPVVLAAAGTGGALTLAFEIAATRLLTMVLGSSTYSVSCVLCLTLIGMAIGSFIVSKYLLRYAQPALISAAALALSAVSLCVLTYVADSLPWGFIACFNFIAPFIPNNMFGAALLSRFLISMAVVLFPAICGGAVLPLLFDATTSKSDAQTASRVFAVNSLGCIIGAFATGFLLIPGLSAHSVSGIQVTLLLLSLLNAGLATCLFVVWTRSFIVDRETQILLSGIVTVIVVAVVLDVVLFKPRWNTIVMSSGPSFYSPAELQRVNQKAFMKAIMANLYGTADSPMLFYREGLNSTVTVERNVRSNALFLKNDGKVEACLPLDKTKAAPTSDISTHLALAELPLKMPEMTRANVLLIGLGTGTTAGALRANPKVADLTVAELEPAVLQAGGFFGAVTGDPLSKASSSPHMKVIVNDGRYVLASATGKYDAIICQPSDPWVNGAAELYSLEFFRLAKSRLSESGVFCQWIPLYSINSKTLGVLTRTFSEAFPNAAIYHQRDAGECILLGLNDNPPSAERGLALKRTEKALFIGVKGIRQLAPSFARATEDGRINTDDNLVAEFDAAANALTQEQQITENIKWLDGTTHR
jgi:spermidine synthase